MLSKSLIARLAACAAVCAVGVPAAIAAAAPAADTHTNTRPDGSVAAASGPTVLTPASERSTVRAGGAAAVAATSTNRGFLGIATELTTIPALSGSGTRPDTPFVNLLGSLSPGAPLVLRLGGNSADDSWWATPGMKKPPYLHTLTPRWASDVRALLKALGGKAILGVNLEEDARVAGAQRQGCVRSPGPGTRRCDPDALP